jgi:hypothetical protein
MKPRQHSLLPESSIIARNTGALYRLGKTYTTSLFAPKHAGLAMLSWLTRRALALENAVCRVDLSNECLHRIKHGLINAVLGQNENRPTVDGTKQEPLALSYLKPWSPFEEHFSPVIYPAHSLTLEPQYPRLQA